MKKIALFLALIMLLSCGIVFTGCSNSQSEASINEDISSEVKYALMAKIAAYDAINGKSLVYYSHTITIITVKEGENYSVKGTVYAMENGTKYSATYSGEVEYDVAADNFDCDIEIGTFR